MRSKHRCCQSPRKRRCDFYGKTVSIFISIAFILSTLSILDCRFIDIDVGFVPDGAVYNSTEFCIGLWSLQDPYSESGRCLNPKQARDFGNMTGDGQTFYGSVLSTDDTMWTVAQLMAIIGLSVAVINVILCWMTICSKEKKRSDWIMGLSIICFACEGIKLGLFFDIEPCTSEDIWRLTEGNITRYHSAEQCFFQRGSYLSLSAILCYMIPLILLFSHLVCPTHAHESVAEMDYDDITLPSFLQSIGESSKNSRSTSSSGKSQSSNVRRDRLSQQMAAIVEDLRY